MEQNCIDPDDLLNSVTDALTRHRQQLDLLRRKYNDQQQALDNANQTISVKEQELTTLIKSHDEARQASTTKINELQQRAKNDAAKITRLQLLVDSFINTGAQQQAALSQHLQTTPAHHDPGNAPDLAEEFAKLVAKSNKLEAALKDQKIRTASWHKHYEDSVEKRRRMKDQVLLWQQYIDAKGLKSNDIAQGKVRGVELSLTPRSASSKQQSDPALNSPSSDRHRRNLLGSERESSFPALQPGMNALTRHEVVNGKTELRGAGLPSNVKRNSKIRETEPSMANLSSNEHTCTSTDEPQKRMPTSSQSTQGDDPSAPPMQTSSREAPPGNDSDPEIVQERPVKRRRLQTEAPQNEINTSRPLVRIKQEPESSPVQAPVLILQDTFDLDEGSGMPKTPKRKRLGQQTFERSREPTENNGTTEAPSRTESDASIASSAHLRSSMPPETRRCESNLGTDPRLNRSFGDRPLEDTLAPHEIEDTVDKTRIQVEASPPQDVKLAVNITDFGDDDHTTSDRTPRSLGHSPVRSDKYPWRSGMRYRSPLNPLNANELGPHRPTKGRRVRGHSDKPIEAGIEDLAEDGELVAKRPQHDNTPEAASNRSRISKLLEAPLPRQRQLLTAESPPGNPRSASPRQPTTGSKGQAAKHKSPPAQRDIQSLRKTSAPAATTTPFQRPQLTATKPPAPAKQSAKPMPIHRLRDLLPEALAPEDFRPNPAWGAAHAHKDETRGHARQSHPACSDPTCPRCADTIRKMIDIGGPLPRPRPLDLNASSPAEELSSQEAEERRLLRGQLGPEYETIMRNMTPLERENVLKTARVRDTADMYGRHRETWGRARSPTGYWDVDMGSTQELIRGAGEEVDEKGKARDENVIVRERWREAVSGKGRWVFRDEI